MALITAFTVIRVLSVFHITVAYYFLVKPQLLADQTAIIILGESMQLVRVCPQQKP